MNRRELLLLAMAAPATIVAIKGVKPKPCKDTDLVRVQVYDGEDWQTCSINYSKDAMHLD